MSLVGKIKPYASWAALLASIIMIVLQAWSRTVDTTAHYEAEQHSLRQDVTALSQDAVRRREMDDLKDSVRRIENKVDNVLANQRSGR